MLRWALSPGRKSYQSGSIVNKSYMIVDDLSVLDLGRDRHANANGWSDCDHNSDVILGQDNAALLQGNFDATSMFV